MADRREQTRERIIAAAARVLRRRGYAGAGVDAMAAEAELTSGAIYAHFRGKEELLTAVVEASVDASESIRERGLDGLAGDAWVRAMLRRYLSPQHHDAVEAGCPMPPLVSELGRCGEGPRRAFAAAARRLLKRVETRWGEAAAVDTPVVEDADERRRRAMAGLALAVGGIALSRALGDDDLAAEWLDACRTSGVDAIVGDGTRAHEARPAGTAKDTA